MSGTMKYKVTVLTPTLVGDGNKLAPIDYMVWRDQVNVLDQNRIFKLLSKGPRLEGYLTQLRKATKLDFASWGGFAQNYAGRRIPFEDASYTPTWEKAPAESLSIPTFAASGRGPFLPGAAMKGALRTAFIFANLKPGAVRDLAAKLPTDRAPRKPAEPLENQAAGPGGSDRMRWFSVSDSNHPARDSFRVYLLRLATLTARGPQQYTLGWKPAPTFAEMADPGTTFEGDWLEHSFLNEEPVRQALRWSAPMTRERLFDAANRYAQKQLEIHAQYAQWTGLESLAAAIAELNRKLEAVRNEGGCLLALGWGAGFTSKSAATVDEDDRKILATLPYYQRAIQSGLPFPKTRRVVFLKNRPASLPGWIELRV
jgi:CRISPR-associated protein Csm5